MTLPSGITNAGPPRRFGGAGGGGGVAAPISMDGAANYNVLWVDKSSMVYGADGSVQYPFNSIQDAVTAAAALVPTASNPVAVVVMPGVYTEWVTLATPYVYLFGWDRDTTILTYDDGSTLRIAAQDVAVCNMTVNSDADYYDGVFISAPGAAYTRPVLFRDCLFTGDTTYFYAMYNTRIHCVRCTWRGPDVPDDFFLSDESDDSLYEDCVMLSRSQCSSSGTYTFLRCDLASMTLDGLGLDVPNMRLAGCVIRDDTVLAPFVVTATPTSFEMRDCRIVNGLGAGYDFTATEPITGATIENNVMARGLPPNVSHVNPVKNVGAAGHKDFYPTVQDALTACDTDDCVVRLLRAEVLTAALTPPTRPVAVDGQSFALTRAAGSPIVTVADSMDLTLRRLAMTGSIDVTGGRTTVEDSTLAGIVDVQAGDENTEVTLRRTTVAGDGTDFYALRLADADPAVNVERGTHLKGSANQPAIYWESVNSNLRLAHATVIAGAGNVPFARSAAQEPEYRAHHTAFNDTPAAWATNLVPPAQQFNSIDPATDY